jgi:biotin transporter BioY
MIGLDCNKMNNLPLLNLVARMAPPNKALVDGALILIGAGISILFISTDGNGQNPGPVAGEIMIVVLVTGVVSFLLARFVRSLPLAIIASVIITDLLFILYGICQLNSSSDPYASEATLMFPIVFVVETAPAILLSSIGLGRLASRFCQKRTLPVEKGTPDFDDAPANM